MQFTIRLKSACQALVTNPYHIWNNIIVVSENDTWGKNGDAKMGLSIPLFQETNNVGANDLMIEMWLL